MTHQAGAKFFDSKRPWSRRKDLILGYYLKPYLPKVATQGRPINVVDGFAGPGAFGDGSPGSPVIICKIVSEMTPKVRVPIRVHLIERDPSLFRELVSRTSEYSPHAVQNGAFADLIPTFEDLAKTEAVFLYLDPFTVTGLPLESLNRVFGGLRSGSSVEMLLNFSGGLLTRVMCAVMRVSDQAEDGGEPSFEGARSATATDLDRVVGGDWWQRIICSTTPFPDKVEEVTRGYCDQLRSRFREVCYHDIREHSSHRVPKYTLIFASRSPHALELMNDAMVKSRDWQAAEEAPSDPTLFETRPLQLVPEKERLPGYVLRAAGDQRTTRGRLILRVIQEHFGEFGRSEVRGAIEALLKSGQLQSSTRSTRINDDVEIWRTRS